MQDGRDFVSGLVCSLVGHVALFVFLVDFHAGKFEDFGRPIVYSVTLDRGEKVGGIAQAPEKKKTEVAPPKKVKKEAAPQEKNTTEEKKKSEEPQPDPEAEVSLAEETPKPTPKPKPKATPKPKPKPTPKKKAAPPKKTTSKKKSPPKKPKEPSLDEINKRLQAAVQRYSGESTDAGGTGFGSIGAGKEGFGGGQTRPPEFFRYQSVLEHYIKSGWRWHDTRAVLKARVCFRISASGDLARIELCGSSGNANYDASVVRAVRKANPVPPPPTSVYHFFKEVRMTFSPGE